ncbi:hypothetical protein JCM11641_001812 [Rhodosporidiobolus odoratus]
MTTSPAVSVIELTPDDIPRVAVLDRLAFAPTSFAQQLFSSVSAQDYETWYSARLAVGMTAIQSGHPYKMRIAKVEGQVAGFAWWEDVPARENNQPGKGRTWPKGAPEVAARLRGEAVDARVGAIKEAYYKVLWLAVHPEHQGRGIGGMLMREGLDAADQRGLPMHVVAVNDMVSSTTSGYSFRSLRDNRDYDHHTRCTAR